MESMIEHLQINFKCLYGIHYVICKIFWKFLTAFVNFYLIPSALWWYILINSSKNECQLPQKSKK